MILAERGFQSNSRIITTSDEMLQDLILAAINEAGRKVDEELQGQVAGLTGGMKIPGF
jgi:DNA-binding protein YbaB